MLQLAAMILGSQNTILAIFLAVFISLSVSAQVDPQIEWKMIRLNHFDLIYDAKHQELAVAYARHLEGIAKTLSSIFTEIPDKTLVVLNDRTDLTNGYATAIPESTIVAFPALPGPLESIYEHSDWPRELIMHEYTHILSFEPRHGVVRVLYSLFGSIITPNVLLPRWWLEGIAVEMETRQSAFGRLRSTGQDAALRSFVVDQSLSRVDLAQINEVTIPTWPGGARPYLFGSLMWSEMIAMNSPTVANELVQRYGRRLPFLLNGPAEDTFGLNYQSIFGQMLAGMATRVHDQLKILRTLPPTQTDDFMIKSTEAFSPAVSPDGLKMAYLTKDETTRRSIRILQRPTIDVRFSEAQTTGGITQDINEQGDVSRPIPTKDGPPTGTISRISWFPDSQQFLFDRVMELNRYHETSDLWAYDVSKKKSKQITKGLRAREPNVSPDGQKAAFVKLGPGSTAIAILDLTSNLSEVVYQPPILTTVSFPVFWNANEVIFGERSTQGQEGLRKLDLRTKKITPVLTDFSQARLPQMTSMGLTFSSTQNGVQNLYLANDDLKTARPLTHSLTSAGVAAFDEANREFYITELTSRGQHLRILPNGEWSRLEKKTLPRVNPLYADRYPTSLAPPADFNLPSEFSVEDYSPYRHLWPRYWLPGFVAGPDGTFVSASLSQSDPVGLHAYSLTAAYDTAVKYGSYNFLYNNNTTDATWVVGAFDYHTYLVYTSNEIHSRQQQAHAKWQLPSLSTDLYGSVGWKLSQKTYLTSKINRSGPTIGFNWVDINQAGEQISPETGSAISFEETSFIRDDVHEGFDEFRLSWTQYFSKWLPKRHAIMARVQSRFVEDQISRSDYESTLAFALFNNTILSQYLMRGYPTGAFLFKSMANYTLEYRFPVMPLYQGSGTIPLFFKRLHGAVVADGIQLDGLAYDPTMASTVAFPFQTVPKWKIFWDAGMELKLDITLGYHFPLTVYGGCYWPMNREFATASPQYAFGLLL